MILINNLDKSNFTDYGIAIPRSRSSTTRVIEYLCTLPVIKEKITQLIVEQKTVLIDKEDLLRAHSPAYINRLYSDKLEQEIIRAYELKDKQGNLNRYNPSQAKLPLKQLLNRIITIISGTYECCIIAMKKGFCFYFGGGMHHAKSDYGEGFCLLNDVVIAVKKLQHEKKITSCWIIDLDAHKGDGTAALTRNDPSIITLSIHMAKGWPLDGEKYLNGKLNPSFIASDIDIPVMPGEDGQYNKKLKKGLTGMDEYDKPRLALILAGSDPYQGDTLQSASGLNLTLEQMKERDIMVYKFLVQRKIKMAYVTAGGYGNDYWKVYAQFLEWILSNKK